MAPPATPQAGNPGVHLIHLHPSPPIFKPSARFWKLEGESVFWLSVCFHIPPTPPSPSHQYLLPALLKWPLLSLLPFLPICIRFSLKQIKRFFSKCKSVHAFLLGTLLWFPTALGIHPISLPGLQAPWGTGLCLPFWPHLPALSPWLITIWPRWTAVFWRWQAIPWDLCYFSTYNAALPIEIHLAGSCLSSICQQQLFFRKAFLGWLM